MSLLNVEAVKPSKLYSTKSPFDVAGIKTKATTKDILDAIKESRAGAAEQNDGADP